MILNDEGTKASLAGTPFFCCRCELCYSSGAGSLASGIALLAGRAKLALAVSFLNARLPDCPIAPVLNIEYPGMPGVE